VGEEKQPRSEDREEPPQKKPERDEKQPGSKLEDQEKEPPQKRQRLMGHYKVSLIYFTIEISPELTYTFSISSVQLK